jgi:hypothetical protein
LTEKLRETVVRAKLRIVAFFELTLEVETRVTV